MWQSLQFSLNRFQLCSIYIKGAFSVIRPFHVLYPVKAHRDIPTINPCHHTLYLAVHIYCLVQILQLDLNSPSPHCLPVTATNQRSTLLSLSPKPKKALQLSIRSPSPTSTMSRSGQSSRSTSSYSFGKTPLSCQSGMYILPNAKHSP